MRNVAIVGAGQAGLLTAHDLLRHGYKVTLFSDKTPEDFLTKTRPTGTPSMSAASGASGCMTCFRSTVCNAA